MVNYRSIRTVLGCLISMVLFSISYVSVSVFAFDSVPLSHTDAMAEINATGHALKTADLPIVTTVDRQSPSAAAKHVQLLTALDGEFA